VVVVGVVVIILEVVDILWFGLRMSIKTHLLIILKVKIMLLLLPLFVLPRSSPAATTRMLKVDRARATTRTTRDLDEVGPKYREGQYKTYE
jgi:hypothetical protein